MPQSTSASFSMIYNYLSIQTIGTWVLWNNALALAWLHDIVILNKENLAVPIFRAALARGIAASVNLPSKYTMLASCRIAVYLGSSSSGVRAALGVCIQVRVPPAPRDCN